MPAGRRGKRHDPEVGPLPGGPPRAGPGDAGAKLDAARTNSVMVRLSDEELGRFEARMRRDGGRRRGTYARELLAGGAVAAVGDRRDRRPVPLLNVDHWARLQDMAASLEGLACHLDTGHIVGPAATGELQQQLEALAIGLRQVRLALLGIEEGS